MIPIFRRLLQYSLSGTLGLTIDLSLLYLLVTTLQVPYMIAVPLSFLIAVTIHYSICRTWVFRGTTRPLKVGYIYFISILLFSLLIVQTIVVAGVELLELNLYVARIIAAFIAGCSSFYLNARYNFRLLAHAHIHAKKR